MLLEDGNEDSCRDLEPRIPKLSLLGEKSFLGDSGGVLMKSFRFSGMIGGGMIGYGLGKIKIIIKN